MNIRLATPMLVVLTGWLVGCSAPDFHCPPLRLGHLPKFHREAVAPEPIEPDTAGIEPVEPDQLLSPCPTYWKLTEDECARLAVSKAVRDVRTRMQDPCCGCEPKLFQGRQQHAAALADEAIDLASRKAAGQAASQALQALYALAAALAQQDVLRTSLEEIARLEDVIGRMRTQKLPVGNAEMDLARQRLDLLTRAADVQLAVGRLNQQLSRLLGLPTDGRQFFWPAIEWRAEPMLIDSDALVSHGLTQRADLILVRLMRHCIDCDTLPVVQAVLTGDSGTASCRGHFCQAVSCFLHPDCELAPACHDLQVKERELKEQVVAEIREAALVVSGRYDQVRIAKEKAELAHERLDRLRRESQTLGVSQVEIGTAQVAVFTAQGEVVERLAAYQSAVVSLREVEGVLADPYLGRPSVTRLPSP